MSEFQVYIWSILDNLSSLCQVIGFIVFLSGAIITIICTACAFDNGEYKFLLSWILPIIAIPFLILCFMIPNSKQYAMIKVFPKIVNNEVVKEIPQDMIDMYTMAKEAMKEMVNND